MNIELHIEELVLRGFQHKDQQGIADGLQHELSRLLAEPQMAQRLAAMGDVPQINAGNIQIAHGARPQSIGAQVACGIGAGVSGKHSI